MKNFDFTTVLHYADGKENFGREIVEIMIQELTIQQSQLLLLLEQKNWKQLSFQIEKLYDSSIYCGMEKIRYLTDLLYITLRQQEFDKIALQIEELQLAINHALHEACKV